MEPPTEGARPRFLDWRNPFDCTAFFGGGAHPLSASAHLVAHIHGEGKVRDGA